MTDRPLSSAAAMSPAVVLRDVRPYGERPVSLRVLDGRLVPAGGPGDGFEPDAAGRTDVVVDCAGLVMLPGLVDLHTHLREPGGEDCETVASGTRAAVRGGYRAVFAMANTRPVADTATVVEHVAALARAGGYCHVHPVGAVTTGLAGRDLAPLAEMAASRAGVRVFSDDGRCVEDAALMWRALRIAGDLGAVIAQHAQSTRLAPEVQVNAGEVAERLGLAGWPPAAEETIVARDAILAGATGAHVHVCHVSTAGSVEVVRWAKHRGLPITAEVTPHHLALDDSRALTGDARFKVNPPLRSRADVLAVRAGLADGTIDAVATDHAPHPDAAKAAGWVSAPPGMLGLQTALPVVIDEMVGTGLLDWRGVAAVMADNPARIGRLPGADQALGAGAPATFCLVAQRSWTLDAGMLVSGATNSPFLGRTFSHRVVATVIDGRVVYADGSLPGLLVSGDRSTGGAAPAG